MNTFLKISNYGTSLVYRFPFILQNVSTYYIILYVTTLLPVV
jgi:hypothetical protein